MSAVIICRAAGVQREFPSIYNHWAWSEVARLWKNFSFVFFGKIFTTLFRNDSSRKFREIGRREIGKVVRYLPDPLRPKKIRLALQLSLLHRSRPKSARISPRQYI